MQKAVIVILQLGEVVLSGSLEVVGSLELKPDNLVKKFNNVLSLFQISYERMLEMT